MNIASCSLAITKQTPITAKVPYFPQLRYTQSMPQSESFSESIFSYCVVYFSEQSSTNSLNESMDVVEEKTVFEQFLSLLDNDINGHRENLKTIDADWLARVESLVGDIEVDLDQPLPEDSRNESRFF